MNLCLPLVYEKKIASPWTPIAYKKNEIQNLFSTIGGPKQTIDFGSTT
jgi:hypothetical protein